MPPHWSTCGSSRLLVWITLLSCTRCAHVIAQQPAGCLADPQPKEQVFHYSNISKCQPGCAEVGTCYEPLGRCDCPFGRYGAACEHFHPRRPEPKTHNAAWCATEMDCGQSLGRGQCETYVKRREQKCKCAAGWGGPKCDQKKSMLCMGGCSCFGECHSGFCKCKLGHFGVDCALTLGEDAKSVVRKRCHLAYPTTGKNEAPTKEEEPELPETCRLDPMIYVYELPPAFNTHLVADTHTGWPTNPNEPSMHPSLWPGDGYVGAVELFLWERLLSSDHRTTDPNQADFFFVPTLGRPAVGGFSGSVGRYQSPRLKEPHHSARHQWQYWEDVISYISNTYPFWNRNGGADHLFVMMGDHGACESPRGVGIPSVLKPAILLSHWGYTSDNRHLAKADWPYYEMGPCYRPHHDILIPPPQQHTLRHSPLINPDVRNRVDITGDLPTPNRSAILSFAGRDSWGASKYSNNVRSKIFALYNNTPGTFIRAHDSPSRMAESVFCLAPSGLAFGDRLFLAIAYGCIPVIIQDNVTQAWEDDLPMQEFAIRVPEVKIPDLMGILESVTPEQRSAKLAALQCIWPRFMWSSVYGASGAESGHDDAFDTLMLALRNRRDFPHQAPPSSGRTVQKSAEQSLRELCAFAMSPQPQTPIQHKPLCSAYNPMTQTRGSWRTPVRNDVEEIGEQLNGDGLKDCGMLRPEWIKSCLLYTRKGPTFLATVSPRWRFTYLMLSGFI